jgi:hypothetical protein
MLFVSCTLSKTAVLNHKECLSIPIGDMNSDQGLNEMYITHCQNTSRKGPVKILTIIWQIFSCAWNKYT